MLSTPPVAIPIIETAGCLPPRLWFRQTTPPERSGVQDVACIVHRVLDYTVAPIKITNGFMKMRRGHHQNADTYREEECGRNSLGSHPFGAQKAGNICSRLLRMPCRWT